MALLKVFLCQVALLGLYKLFLEQVFEDYLVPDELTRNCLVGFVCLLCFGIQLYTENVEDQKSQGETSKTKSRRRTPPDTTESVSEFLDARTVHMMRTLDEAMKRMPMSDGYVQNVIFASAGTEATIIEQTFVTKPDVVHIEEIHATKLDDVTFENEESTSEPVVVPVKVEEVTEVTRNDRDETEEEEEVEEEEEEVEEEEEEEEEDAVEEEGSETKSDVCDEDEVTVIDVSKPISEVEKTKSEDQTKNLKLRRQEEEEPAEAVKKNEKIEEKPDKGPSKEEDVEEEEEEDEDEEEESEEEVTQAKRGAEKEDKKS